MPERPRRQLFHRILGLDAKALDDGAGETYSE